MTVRIYVRHDVTDYAAWRKAYDAFDAKRRKMGVTGQVVYRSIDDANDVTVTHDFTNAEKAKAFASSPDLKAAMEKAGVKGTPQIWFTTRAEQRRRRRRYLASLGAPYFRQLQVVQLDPRVAAVGPAQLLQTLVASENLIQLTRGQRRIRT